MYARYAAGQRADPIDRIAAAHSDPVAVQCEPHVLGGQIVRHAGKHRAAGKLGQLTGVVVVHKILPVLAQRARHRAVVGKEAPVVLLAAHGVIAKADIAAAEHVVLRRHLCGICQQSVCRCVRQHAGKPGARQLPAQPFRRERAGGGYLHGRVTDIRDPLQRLRQIVQALHMLPDGIKLCADLHVCSSLRIRSSAPHAASKAAFASAHRGAMRLCSPARSSAAKLPKPNRCGSTVKARPPSAR